MKFNGLESRWRKSLQPLALFGAFLGVGTCIGVSPLLAQPVESTGNGILLERCAVLLEGGSLSQARSVLAQVRDPRPAERVCVRLYESRLAMEENRLEEAIAGFSECVESREPAPAEVFVGALLGIAEAFQRRGESAEAARRLLQVLNGSRELPDAEPVFQKLVGILSEMNDPLEADFRGCLERGPLGHRALARFYLAQFYFMTGRSGRGLEEAKAFCETHPAHRLCAAAYLQRAERAMESGNLSEAEDLLRMSLKLAKDAPLQLLVSLRQALVSFRKGAYPEALEQYVRIAGRWPDGAPEALFNAGLAAVRSGDLKRATALWQQLFREQGGLALATELELEIALRKVGDAQPEAEEALQVFIRNHPQAPRLSDAQIALAEFYAVQARQNLAAAGPRSGTALVEKAGRLLKVVADGPQSPQTAMQARYLAFFLADAQQPRRDEEVVRIGEEFLRDHPTSQLQQEVRMKLGELYLKMGDSASAEGHFAFIARQDPEAPLAETALFLAGQCASCLLNPGSVDRALSYWDKVAAGKGPLRWKARYQQAAVKSRIGEEREGALLFELILRATEGVSPELRLAARCGRGDALLALSKRETPALEEALSEYRALAEDQEATPVWRNQAVYKMGKAFERSEPLRALECFNVVLSDVGALQSGEYFWSFKAGFDAARLYELQEAWRQAVGVYEKLAEWPGPRSPEARSRARQLRLERFIWD